MLIKPKIYKNISLTAHPEGCSYSVKSQVDYVKNQPEIKGPGTVLVIGSSTGYGLAARIVSAFSCQSTTIGVAFSKKGTAETLGGVGWYNTLAFEKLTHRQKNSHISINGDAFQIETKKQVIETVKKLQVKIDLVIYSIAAAKRLNPETGEQTMAVIKPIGQKFSFKTWDMGRKSVYEKEVLPATDREIENTKKVMGGEDWAMWINALDDAGLLADNFKTIAFSYIGPELTYPIYRQGTLGEAKKHLEKTANVLDRMLKKYNGSALVVISKALVTKASVVIPAVSLYISILYKIMKKKNLHEDCIHQIYRLYSDYLFSPTPKPRDDEGRIRIDDREMRPDVQAEVLDLMHRVNSENVRDLADIEGFTNAFLQFHGFLHDKVDYEKDINLADWV